MGEKKQATAAPYFCIHRKRKYQIDMGLQNRGIDNSMKRLFID
jgi:hypothetical protein